MNADQQILTQLAKEYREVAFAPVNEERRALWKALNGLRECRPLIMMDQLPWHELDVDGDLKLRCRDADARIVEDALRKQLYQAKYFPADKVFEPYLELPKTIEGYHHGVVRREVTLAADEKNDVVSHSYVSQLSSESDLENLKFPDIRVDEAKDKKRWEKVSEMVSGILPVRLTGVRMFHCGIWDDLVEAIGTDNFSSFCGRAGAAAQGGQTHGGHLPEPDRPADGKAAGRRYEPTVHCTGAYTDELPQDKEKTFGREMYGHLAWRRCWGLSRPRCLKSMRSNMSSRCWSSSAWSITAAVSRCTTGSITSARSKTYARSP
ncbi:MAG: hypothetical protein ACLRZH_17105 [Ruthenibacterium lactatiformans]